MPRSSFISFNPLWGKLKRSNVSALALAFALAGGAVLGTALVDSPAQAQSSRQDKPKYTKNFIAAYEPVAEIVNAEEGDFAAAKGQLDQVYAAIENDDDRSAAGNLTLILGNKLKDNPMQRRGLEMMLESGKVPDEQVGQFQFFVGTIAYTQKDYAAARTALEAALAAGHTEDNPEGIIAETYFGEGQNEAGLNYLKGVIEERIASGEAVPDEWAVRGLKAAYEADLREDATEWSTLLVKTNPTPHNWSQGLQVVNAMNSLEPQVQLDLLRLMMATDSLSDRREFVSYIEAADPRIMANEVARVLDAGVQKGVFTTSDDYYSDIKRIVDERAPEDQREAPALAQEAQSDSSGAAAATAGDVFLSLGSYDKAEEMFQLALEKGGVDRDSTLTRLGISQAHQNKLDAAKDSFSQVSGARTAIAQLWTAYVDSKA